MLDEGGFLSIYDPKVSRQQINRDLENYDKNAADMIGENVKSPEQPKNSKFEVKSCPYEAAKNAHAIVICTDWDEFKDYDYSKIYAEMERPAFVFDGRKILNLDELLRIGFRVETVGKNIHQMENYA